MTILVQKKIVELKNYNIIIIYKMSKSRNNKRSNKKQQQKRKQQNGGGYYNDLEAAPIALRPVVASYDDNKPPAPQVGGRNKKKGPLFVLSCLLLRTKNPANILLNIFELF